MADSSFVPRKNPSKFTILDVFQYYTKWNILINHLAKRNKEFCALECQILLLLAILT